MNENTEPGLSVPPRILRLPTVGRGTGLSRGAILPMHFPGTISEVRLPGGAGPSAPWSMSGSTAGSKPADRFPQDSPIPTSRGQEVERQRWLPSLKFILVPETSSDLVVTNPVGIVITYLQADQGLVSGGES